ncbi:dephospho-CoA kinase [uncultured Dokdonia sp.]|uniref:dephospho-CoA kinase n=1 Tax=uncultured Dokdonia sp. TaxID=575653 RepID=UPI002609A279|nr:dephospho-CoA kinase [uncultured Dokdonia sp.]
MIVGLTGGIGSGKTTVAGFFKKLGVPVYIADDEAKRLMAISPDIRKEIIQLLGREAYTNNGLNRTYVAAKVFKDTHLLEQLNAIVHPRVAIHFKNWYHRQDSPYVIKEAAILFENGGYKECDFMLLVTAPMHMRIERLKKRDDSSEEEIKDRMGTQWSDARKQALSDFSIENIFMDQTKEKVLRIHNHILLRIDRKW